MNFGGTQTFSLEPSSTKAHISAVTKHLLHFSHGACVLAGKVWQGLRKIVKALCSATGIPEKTWFIPQYSLVLENQNPMIC